MSMSGTSTSQSSEGDKDGYVLFDVLYCSRKKNKKSMVDGLLKISRNGVVTLTETTEVGSDDEKESSTAMISRPYVYKGIQKEVARIAFSGNAENQGLGVDATVVVGPYEAEILSIHCSSTKGTLNAEPKSKLITKTMAPRGLTTKLCQPGGLSVSQAKRMPLHPRSTVGGQATRQISSSKSLTKPIKNSKNGISTSKQLCLKGVSTSTETSSSSIKVACDVSLAVENVAAKGIQPLKPKSKSLLLKRPFVPPVLSSSTRKRPMTQDSKTSVIGRRPLLSKPPPTSASSEQSVAVSTGNRKLDSSSSSTNPSIGDIDIPNSVRTSLKAHQEEGVVFLWKCLTGLGEARPYEMPGFSEAILKQRILRGCILGDCMGSGKSLMTIAVICALYRQKRDSVR